MEIDTTKLGKHFVISPTIEVNNLNAYNDILVSGTSFRDLFDGNENKFLDTRNMIMELHNLYSISFGAEQIHAFNCDISKYRGGLFKSVTLRHDSSVSETDAGKSEVWLFVTVLDEESNPVDTFFSTNKARQISDSTTWRFDSIEIKPNYKIFEFRITTTEGVADRNPPNNRKNLRSRNILNGDTKLSIENWTTINQAGRLENFTTDCTLEIDFNKLNIRLELDTLKQNLNYHTNNNNIHLDADDINSLIENHQSIEEISNSYIDLSEDLEDHIGDTSIHLTSENVSSLISSSDLSEDLEVHIGDTSIHLTSENVSDLISSSDLSSVVNSLKETDKTNSTIIDNFINSRLPQTYDVCFEETANQYIAINEETIESFATDTSLFEGTYITSVSVRKKEGDTYGELPLATNPAWLYATCYDENNNVIKVVFSHNNTTQNPNERVTSWNFDNFFITSDINTIEYRISFTDGVQEKRGKIRSASIRANGNKITKEGWFTVDGANKKATFITDVLIDYERLAHSDNVITHLLTFNSDDGMDNYTANGFQLGRLHLKPGKIRKILIPYNSSPVESEGTFYLAVQIFKHGDIDTEQENKSNEETIYSSLPFSMYRNSNGYYSFVFDNLIIPEDFRYVRFMFTTSKDLTPNGITMSNTNVMRLRPIKRGEDFLNFDTDECCIISSTGQKSNYLVACDFTYEEEYLPKDIIYSKKWRLEFDGIHQYIQNIYNDVINTYYMSINASKITKNGFDLSSLNENSTNQDIIIADIDFGLPVSNVYVENYIKSFSSENLPLMLPLF